MGSGRTWRRCIAGGLILVIALSGGAHAHGKHHHHRHHHHHFRGGSFALGVFGAWPAYRYNPYYGYRERTIRLPVDRPVTVAPLGGAVPSSYCREYQADATIDGRPQPVYGVACYRPDGSWQILTQSPLP
jgi:hypothetical protein